MPIINIECYNFYVSFLGFLSKLNEYQNEMYQFALRDTLTIKDSKKEWTWYILQKATK